MGEQVRTVGTTMGRAQGNNEGSMASSHSGKDHFPLSSPSPGRVSLHSPSLLPFISSAWVRVQVPPNSRQQTRDSDVQVESLFAPYTLKDSEMLKRGTLRICSRKSPKAANVFPPPTDGLVDRNGEPPPVSAQPLTPASSLCQCLLCQGIPQTEWLKGSVEI